jgi:hypothetical protein
MSSEDAAAPDNEKVDVALDGVVLPRPHTRFV